MLLGGVIEYCEFFFVGFDFGLFEDLICLCVDVEYVKEIGSYFEI